ncbi:thiol reductase thioredoxin (plasmid) [Deinococcus aetherius]|uniref:Thioredoxin n=1 Tax=Deinococcus aetherius TaxID=200252 RepID=A0ABM8AJ33_9DEIO|nr:thioredoxin [Deinococcus aetherius]BDP43842.1 thiol reductase thioredoxin [Deinococcus aetherius]
MTQPIPLTDQTFADETAHGLTLVDFWADWCGPCHMIAPTVEGLAAEYAGRVKVAKVNVDEQPETAGRHGIRSIPTLILFRDGQPVRRVVGVQPGRTLARLLDGALADTVGAP